MKRLFTLLIPIALQSTLCSAQNFEWATQVGGTGTDDVMGVTTDVSGNVFSTGSYEGTGDFDPGAGTLNFTSAGGRDAFIVKQSANGSFLWAKTFGAAAHDYGRKVRTDASGNVYLVGYFSGTVDFNPGAGVNNLTSQSTGTLQDLFVVKLDAAGNFVWAVQRQSPAGQQFVNDCDIKLDAANNLYMVYSFGDGYAGSQVKIEKTNSSNGAAVWTKAIYTLGGPGGLLAYSNLALDASGNIFVAGEFGGDVNFDPDGGTHILTAVASPTAYVLKLTNAGAFTWVSLVGNITGTLTRAFDVTTDAAGNAIVAGRYAGTVDFDPGAGVHNETATAIDAYLLKLTSTGAFSWVRTWGGNGLNSAWGVATDAAGAIYTTGMFAVNATFGVPPNTVTFNTGINTYNEAFTVKFNNGGGLEWAQHIGGGLGQYAIGNAIAISNLGAVYTGGSFDYMTDFNMNNPGTTILFTSGNTDGFVQKVAGCAAVNTGVSLAGSTLSASASGATYQWINCSTGPVAGATAQTFAPTVTGNYAVIVMQGGCGDTSVCTSVIGTDVSDVQHAAAAIYPNPTTGALSIELNKQYSNVEVTITSAVGAVVSKTAYSNTRSINASVDGANGIYFISINADGAIIARERVVKAD
ncbi:T9SS type A sorting domain-containing protein [Polluticoccus soli]|uniref:T9SS type A sorting domain-containing protein n=1 Tax=Polluticoccus soli TaxID=3034150 RepID=UPI0023E334DD|nr:T9SS type A sorting domain-containing protein [Flavipsychrobacter sp. JY13-12]